MPIKKISKKTLSRNLKVKKSPLKVLPLKAKSGLKHQMTAWREHKAEQHHEKFNPTDTRIRCSMEEIQSANGKHLKKNGREKAALTFRPLISIRFTMNALRWIFLLIFIYLAAGIILVMIQDGLSPMKNVVIYSVIGFSTFFMGYLGLVFAKDILRLVNSQRHPQDEIDINI